MQPITEVSEMTTYMSPEWPSEYTEASDTQETVSLKSEKKDLEVMKFSVFDVETLVSIIKSASNFFIDLLGKIGL